MTDQTTAELFENVMGSLGLFKYFVERCGAEHKDKFYFDNADEASTSVVELQKRMAELEAKAQRAEGLAKAAQEVIQQYRVDETGKILKRLDGWEGNYYLCDALKLFREGK